MKRLGLSIASYAIRNRNDPGWSNALAVLDHCKTLGAGCLQIGVRNWQTDFARKVRDHRESHGILLEGQISLPDNPSGLPGFESGLKAAREAGATIVRTVCLGGRRYETLRTFADWNTFKKHSLQRLELAEPILKKLNLTLAVENHKDWRTGEFLEILNHLSSEHIRVNFDFGNNLALLENPHDVASALAPWTVTTHIKDMGLQASTDGFLLSEVPLGTGTLDLPAIISTCEKHHPATQFNLEMITREPLVIPCLTKPYWATMPGVPASELARTLTSIPTPTKKLPSLTSLTPAQKIDREESNIRHSFHHAQTNLFH